MVSARKDDSLRLLIRADAAAAIGTGHIMRCLALAQAWQSEGGMVTFLMADSAPALAARIKAEGFSVIHHPHPDGSAADSLHTVAVAQTLGTERVVVDGYHFGAAYQQQLKAAGLKVLFIDDNGHADYYAADWVLNQNIHAHPELYSHREPYTQLLLGTRFALLRKEFWPWRGWQRQIAPVARKILVTLGGGDPDNVTLKVMQALQQVTVPDLEVVVVVGGSNPHFETLQAAADTASIKFDLCRNVSNMPELMAWADVAIAGGGSTCWELAFMGLSSIIIPLADNQQTIAKVLDQANIVKALDNPWTLLSSQFISEIETLLLQRELRENFLESGKNIVDGNGVDRVNMLLIDHQIWLRAVQPKDCKLLWNWANDPTVRSVSFSQDPIPYEEHEQWFSQKLKSESCYFYIACNRHDYPIGQIRFDCFNENLQEAEISISLDPKYRTRGLGSLLISMSVRRLFLETPIQIVRAFIKAQNLASVKSFEKAGFCHESQEYRDEDLVFCYSQSRAPVQQI